jgi:methionine aminopeptidase
MTIESDSDLHGLRRAGKVVALAIEAMKEALEPGMTPAELDAVGAEVYERYGARSAPQFEPIIAAGSERIVESPDGWTADGNPAVHYEHTIVVTRGSPIVLTAA